MIDKPETKIIYVCAVCGSDDVTTDALARWSVDAQDWILSALLQNTDCEACGGQTRLIERPVCETASQKSKEQQQ